ncbi:MAG: DUF1007 family protein [Spirochaetaceae bacterium]
MSFKHFFLLILLMSFFTFPLFSHPHMFIDTEVTVVLEEDTLEGFYIEWTFDEMFTSSIRMDYDRNRDGSFNERETKAIENNAFSNLRNYNYFISITSKDEKYRADTIEDFEAELVEDRLVYRFFVPYKKEITPEEKELTLIIFDDTFYCDIAYKSQDPVKIRESEKILAESRIYENEEKPVDYDPAGGRERDNSSGREYAAGTAYPTELQLTLKKR